MVTGANGFVGRWIVRSLVTRGYEVHALSRRGMAEATEKDAPEIVWHSGDLMMPGFAAGLLADLKPSHLVHSAWFTSHGAFWHSDANYRWVAASLDLLDNFRLGGGRRFVGIGSCAEYDWAHGFCSEDITPLVPSHPYGVCKVAFFKMAAAFCNANKLEFAWARIFYPFGPHEDKGRLVPHVIRSLLAGEVARCTVGTQIRDFLHVADCGDAIAAVADSHFYGPINIGRGEPLSLKSVISTIASKLDANGRVNFGAVPFRPDDPPVLIPDVRRLNTQVGWSSARPIDEAIDDSISWWKSAQRYS